MSFSAYGVMPPPPFYQWPQDGPLQQPGSRRIYTYVAGSETSGGTDPLTIVAASIAPSGTGEAAIGSVAVSGHTIDVLMSGGVPGRQYIVQLLLTVASGQIFEVLIAFPIDRTLAAWPLAPPPSALFGAVTTWRATSGTGLQDSSGNFLTDSSGNALVGSSATPTGGLTDSAGNTLQDSAGNTLFGSSATPTSGLTDSAGNTLQDSAGNTLFGSSSASAGTAYGLLGADGAQLLGADHAALQYAH